MRETEINRTLSGFLVAVAFFAALFLLPGLAHAQDGQAGGDAMETAPVEAEALPQAVDGEAGAAQAETPGDVPEIADSPSEGSATQGDSPEAAAQGGDDAAAGAAGQGEIDADTTENATEAPQANGEANVPEQSPEVQVEQDATVEASAGSGTEGTVGVAQDDSASALPDAAALVEQSSVPSDKTATAAAPSPVKPTTTSNATTPKKATSNAKAATTAKGSGTETKGGISYRAHVSNIGWMAYVANGKTAGGIQEDEQLEAIQVKLTGVGGSIVYQAYAKGKGWISAADGKTSGTTGLALAIQALRADLKGEAKSLYDLYYRVYVDEIGWLGWAKNNAKAGSTEFNRPLEGVQFKLVAKGGAKPSGSGSATNAAYIPRPKVSVQTHVQNIGWQKAVGNGKVAGTSGKALRMEALKISITGTDVVGGATYRTHVQNVGWQKYVKNGALAGTSGRALRLEAMNLNLTSDMAKCYDVFYRVHVQNIGWVNWSMNNELSGTTGQALRLEAIQVKVTLKGGSPSDGTYIYLDAGHGWGAGRPDSGAVGSGYRESDLTQELVGKIARYAKDDYGLDVYNNSGCKINFTGRQNDAMNRGCTSFVSIHFNAGGGSGSESYAYTTQGKQLQSVIHPYLINGVGLRDRGAKTYGYNVVSGPVPAVLLEICFIDTGSDMRQYQARKDTIAKQIARGLYEASRRGF